MASEERIQGSGPEEKVAAVGTDRNVTAMIDTLLRKLEVDTGRYSYAQTDSLRAVAATRQREDGTFEVSVHIQPNIVGLAAPIGCEVTLKGGAVPTVAKIGPSGRALWRGVLPGRYSLGVVGSPVRDTRVAALDWTLVTAGPAAVLDACRALWNLEWPTLRAPDKWQAGIAFERSTGSNKGTAVFMKFEVPGTPGMAFFIHEDEEARVLLTVDIEGDSAPTMPIQLAVVESQTGAELVSPWVVLHKDPFNRNHWVASVQLAATPGVNVVGLQPAFRVFRENDWDTLRNEVALRRLLESCAGDADRAAWRGWVEREVAESRLPPEAVAWLAPRDGADE